VPLCKNNHVGKNCDTSTVKRFRLPDKIISDRDPRFAAHAFQKLLKLLNIKSNLTTAYHPQSDGATERINQEIKVYLVFESPVRSGYLALVALTETQTG
jgi:transposase InsO family protein